MVWQKLAGLESPQVKLPSAASLKAGRLGIEVTGGVGTDGQLSKGAGRELEVSCGRESGTFVTVQLFTLGVEEG